LGCVCPLMLSARNLLEHGYSLRRVGGRVAPA
jgi:hypothetical protein